MEPNTFIVKQLEVVEEINKHMLLIENEIREINGKVYALSNFPARNLEETIKKRGKETEKFQQFNEYDKLFLQNLESRITILEEESEKYISQ